MPYSNRTSRIADGERIEGSWRHIFINTGLMYCLSELRIYADGMIDCWGLVDFAVFQQKVASGYIATTLPQGAMASAYHIGGWSFDRPWSTLTPQLLIAEVADEIEHLAGRPTTEDRCLAALDRYLDDRNAESLAALRDAYLAVPEHLRVFLLSDQDEGDTPLRLLLTPIGDILELEDADEIEHRVQASDHEYALKYFFDRREEERKWQASPPAWEDDSVTASPSVVRFDTYDGGHPYLANDFPAPITIDGSTFPTVEHAYWALATSDIEARERIANAATAHEARTIGQGVPLRPDWNVVRLAVMLRLVREKFRQHPDLATRLIATGDGRLINSVDLSRYWGRSQQGRNWLGRILELVRAELVESTQGSERMQG